MKAPQPFQIQIADNILDDMFERLRRTRYATDCPNDDWEYGFNTQYLRDLIDYWTTTFGWRVTEIEMNKLAHFIMDWDGLL